MSMDKVAEGVYANVEWDGGNVVCIDTSEGVVLVDTPMLPAHIEQCKSFIAGLNQKGVKYIINTHIHFDHIIGNNLLGGSVIMHEKARENLYSENSTLRETFVPGTPGRSQADMDFILNEPLIAGEIAVISDLAIHLGEKTVKLYHVGGHTPDSMVVYIENDQILITGDTVTNGVHPYKGDACFADWIKALDRLKTFKVKTVIPGHGITGAADTIDRISDYFQKMWRCARDLVADNRTEDEMIEAIHNKMFDYFDVAPEMIERAKIMFDVGTRRLLKEIYPSR